MQKSRFYVLKKEGAFDRFRVDPPLGQHCYSKQLIARYLAGERIDEPSRVFGRRRPR